VQAAVRPAIEEAKAKTMSRHYRTARPASSQPDGHERTSTSALGHARIVPCRENHSSRKMRRMSTSTTIRPDRVDPPGEGIFEGTEYPKEETNPIALADDRLAPRPPSPLWMYPKPYNPTALSFPSTDPNRFAVFVLLGFCLSLSEAVRDHSETPLVPKVGCAF